VEYDKLKYELTYTLLVNHAQMSDDFPCAGVGDGIGAVKLFCARKMSYHIDQCAFCRENPSLINTQAEFETILWTRYDYNVHAFAAFVQRILSFINNDRVAYIRSHPQSLLNFVVTKLDSFGSNIEYQYPDLTRKCHDLSEKLRNR
jgi:hypothetical protein